MSQVIGRVVTGTYETVRGPDVIHRIAVPRDWLIAGELVELDLPRNLTCAACEGGGCDRCGRSGAITLRERGESTEPVQLTLPKRSAAELREQSSFVVRVPGHGGKDRPELGDAGTRGLLLLKIIASDRGDPSVRRVIALEAPVATKHAADKASSGPPSSARVRRTTWGILALVVAIAWIVALIVASATLR